MAKIVAAPMGTSGGAAMRHLVAAGFQVRAITRDPHKGRATDRQFRGLLLELVIWRTGHGFAAPWREWTRSIRRSLAGQPMGYRSGGSGNSAVNAAIEVGIPLRNVSRNLP